MPDQDFPVGQRFSLLYLDKGEALHDCDRMRFRVVGPLYTLLSVKKDFDIGYGRYLEVELGV